jgi:hypothetical protein
MERSHALRFFALATVAWLLNSTIIKADIVTPDSIFPTPLVTTPTVAGTTVDPAGVVTNQYAGHGLLFQSSALGMIGDTKAWVPMVFLILDPAPGHPPGIERFINYPGFINISPSSQSFSSLSITFVGLPLGAGNVQAFDNQGNLLRNGFALIAGKSGQTTATLSGIGAGTDIEITNSTNSDTPWGISQIEWRTQAAPEPASLVLVGIGVLPLGIVAWRRRVRRDS